MSQVLEQHDDIQLLLENASDIIHDVIGEAFRAAKLANYTEAIEKMDKPEPWQTWVFGMLIISACSFSAPLGMLVLPCLSKSLYERTMIFLIALGIGALSGSAMFIMIPQAFHLTELDNFTYHSKSAIIVGALYAFFTVDRILQYALEFRRRRQAKRKVHTSTIVSIMNNTPKVKVRNGTEETTLDGSMSNGGIGSRRSSTPKIKEVDEEKEKAELAEEVGIAMLNNAFARSFSSRRRFAVMSAVDGIELRETSRKNSEAPGRNEFLETVNTEISMNQDRLLKLNSDGFRSRAQSTVKSLEDARESGKQEKKVSDEEVSVDVKIVEKRMVDPTAIEVGSVAYMIIFGSSANNFVDGMSTGAAFSDSILRGLSIGIAVLSQQFPQELGTLAILINSGLGFRRTMLYNLIPIVLSYVGFACGVLLDNIDESFDTYIFSISSGMYLYIFLGTLIPEIRDSVNELMKVDMAESLLVTLLQYLGIAFGIAFMFYMSLMGDVEL
ncbi:unnamed protein product [Cylicocyclus nassatus]|uniref:Uncharacterized protein n=1 Tax=Cylicocyclus nassatus TaxID=53992 RepID=A0AA36DML7_CYLNA|nr:unnamed protein product [Cylicocyclus nassatus]